MQCRHCAAPIRRGEDVCPACGTRQPQMPEEIRCRACGHSAAAVLEVCPHCGHTLRPAILPPLRSVLLGAASVVVVVLLAGRLLTRMTGDRVLSLLPDVSNTPLVAPALANRAASGSVGAVTVPAPQLVAPASGTPYNGESPIIVLRWLPVGGLAGSMAYRVDIGYAIDGQFDWRAEQVIDNTEWYLPSFFGRLADRQGGHHFSWRVTVVTYSRGSDGQPIAGRAVSPTSETWEFVWHD